jgi:hypothetical protein
MERLSNWSNHHSRTTSLISGLSYKVGARIAEQSSLYSTSLKKVATLLAHPSHLYSLPFPAQSHQTSYHTAYLLLLDAKSPSIDLSYTKSISAGLGMLVEFCGISMTNGHHGCLSNDIQRLWVAGMLQSHPTSTKPL